MTGESAAEAGANLAERKIDLVVDHEDPVELDAQLTARGPDRPAGLVHVRLGRQDRDSGAAGSRAPLRDQPPIASPGCRQIPACAQTLRDLESDVVRTAAVLAPRVAESDDEPVDGSAAATREPHDALDLWLLVDR